MKTMYESPFVEVMEVEVEKGFAATGGGGASGISDRPGNGSECGKHYWDDIDIDDIDDWDDLFDWFDLH